MRPPAVRRYALTPSWLATTGALAHELGAQMIIGLNLAADEPALAGAEARAYLQLSDRVAIAALEIGNEPNVYGKFTVPHTAAGLPLHGPARELRLPGVPPRVPGDRAARSAPAAGRPGARGRARRRAGLVGQTMAASCAAIRACGP